MVSGQLANTLSQIKARARRARVYVVGYPGLPPSSGNRCANTLGITTGDIALTCCGRRPGTDGQRPSPRTPLERSGSGSQPQALPLSHFDLSDCQARRLLCRGIRCSGAKSARSTPRGSYEPELRRDTPGPAGPEPTPRAPPPCRPSRSPPARDHRKDPRRHHHQLGDRRPRHHRTRLCVPGPTRYGV